MHNSHKHWTLAPLQLGICFHPCFFVPICALIVGQVRSHGACGPSQKKGQDHEYHVQNEQAKFSLAFCPSAISPVEVAIGSRNPPIEITWIGCNHDIYHCMQGDCLKSQKRLAAALGCGRFPSLVVDFESVVARSKGMRLNIQDERKIDCIIQASQWIYAHLLFPPQL